MTLTHNIPFPEGWKKISTFSTLILLDKLVTNKKAEVDAIREAFNIQIENPVCFLNQETSKHFLNSSNTSDKYQFFLKASQIDSIKRKEEEIEECRRKAIRMIDDKTSHMPKLEEELYKLEVKYKKCQSVDKLRKKLSILMKEYTWSVVINVEKILKTCVDEKQAFLNKQEKIQAKIDDNRAKLAESNQEYNDIKKNIGSLSKQAKTSQTEYDRVQAAYKKVSLEYNAVKSELKRRGLLVDRKKKELSQLNDKLAEEKSNTAKDYEDEKAQKDQKIQAIKKELNKGKLN